VGRQATLEVVQVQVSSSSSNFSGRKETERERKRERDRDRVALMKSITTVTLGYTHFSCHKINTLTILQNATLLFGSHFHE